jgi:hypothetical protein
MIHGETRKVRFEFHNKHNVVGCQLGEIIFYHHGEGVLPAGVIAAEVIAQPQPTVVVEANPYPQPTMMVQP